MTESDHPHHPEVDEDAEMRLHALIDLHARSGRLGEIDLNELPEFRPSSSKDALRAVAEAPLELVPGSARLAVLHDLARADFPDLDSNQAEYRLLAGSIAEGVDPDQVLDDLKMSAQRAIPFADTATGQQLPHHVAAFVGEDLCSIRKVEVGGITATWIFSEIETDAPFDHVVEWVDPRNWPRWGPLLFKQMGLVGGRAPVDIGALGDEHWHGVFHEEVQLVGRVNTLLHCDFWKDGGRAAGMTYELDLSLDGELDVDRGFLSVNDVGPVRRVKALKIVGFTDTIWDQVAALVCPFWTDWMRGAVEGGSTTTPKPPTSTPPGGEAASSPFGEVIDAWVEFFGDSARTYLALFGDIATRASSGGYRAADWVADGNRYWSRLAKDWARAWAYGIELIDEVAEQGIDAGIMPPGAPKEPARGMATAMATGAMGAPPAGAASGAAKAGPETALTPVSGLGAGDHPSCTRLVSIEAGSVAIEPAEVSIGVEQLDDGSYGVRLETTNTTVPPGLYVGELIDASGQKLSPVQLYISRASRAEGP